MSEERMVRIEAVLTAMQADMASVKAEVASVKAEMATKQELGSLQAEVASLRVEVASVKAEMATKEDLAGVAKNVDVSALGRQVQELLAMKDDVTVLTAIAQRLDNTMTRQMSDVLTEVRAEHSRMDRLLNRVRALEEAQLSDRGR